MKGFLVSISNNKPELYFLGNILNLTSSNIASNHQL